MSPGVSIIIPNYNHAPFLEQRIDSVLNQTFQDFELIILDDCSTDVSREVIAKYRDHAKISQIIYNDANSGSVFKQWVKGIENASGKYIWIAESDDFALKEFLEQMVEVLELNPSAGLVFCDSTTVDRDGKPLNTTAETKSKTYAELALQQNFITADNLNSFLISDMVIENASCVLFRRKSLLSIDLRKLQTFTNTGDRFAYIGIALHAGLVYLPKCLSFMRSHENNTTKKSFENGIIHKDRLMVLNYYFSELSQLDSESRKVALFYINNYLSFLTHGTYDDNIAMLRKLKDRNEISTLFYYMCYGYLLLFMKTESPSGIFRGLYYRLLTMQQYLNRDYQK